MKLLTMNMPRIQSLDEYRSVYKKSVEQPEQFWNEIAETFEWKKPWTKTLEWNFSGPDVKWFVDGKLNITENMLDRHLATRGDKKAIIWEPNDPSGETVTLTYNELYAKVCQLGNGLKSLA